MKTVNHKILSLLLSLCISVGLLFNLFVIMKPIEASAAVADELWLYADYNYMLKDTTRKLINSSVPDAAPYISGDTAYIPLAAMTYLMGGSYTVKSDTITLTLSSGTKCVFTSGSTAWTKGGSAGTALAYPAVVKGGEGYLEDKSLKTVYGTSLKSYISLDTGIIIYSTASMSYSDSYKSLKTQIDRIDDLIFDFPTASELYADVEANIGAASHPRLLVDQDRFDELRVIYNKNENLTDGETTHKKYITQVMSEANKYFALSFTETGSGAGWKNADSYIYYRQPYYLYDDDGNRLYGASTYTREDGTVVTLSEYWQEISPWKQQSYSKGEGYDVGGRSNLDVLSSHLKYFGFAWQMTREQKWADAFYLVAQELSKWEHWGEGHFLDCADGSAEFALGFDWIYPAFSGTEEGRAKLRQMAETLFTLGVEVGYNGMKQKSTYTSVLTNITNTNLNQRNNPGTLHRSTIMGSNWRFDWTNNWQTVCTSGMILSSLAVMEYSDMRELCTDSIAKMLPRINKCLIHYAPDGSYIESPGYWEYSTETFMHTIAALESSAGSSYGLTNTVGLHNSYYFVAYITDANYYAWNYHDGNRARVSGATFYLASRLWSDPNLAAIRDNMMNAQMAVGATKIVSEMDDALFYDPSLATGGGLTQLDYHGKNIDTVTMRSSWENDAIFTGLHAGANDVTHGDIDSGTFYLVSGNTIWFGDRGGENYNVSQFRGGDYFYDEYRYLYYKKTIVAHNSVFLKSSTLPRGQVFNSMSDNYARISEFHSDSLGGIAIADMTPQYNSKNSNNLCTSAKRGLLFTNSRSTVVIQDEMHFKSAQDIIWSAESDKIESLSEDGKTAYLRAGGTVVMRVSLLSDDPELKFNYLRDRDELFLTYDTTINSGKIVTKRNSGNEKASDPYERLVVRTTAKDFKMAIVCELINDEREVVGYTLQDMADWETTSDAWVKDADKWLDTETTEYKYVKSQLVKALRRYEEALSDADRFAEARELNKIINSINLQTNGVPAMVETAREYINYINGVIITENRYAKKEFFTHIENVVGFKA